MTGPYRAEFGAIHHEDAAGFLFTVSPPAFAAEVAAALNKSFQATQIEHPPEEAGEPAISLDGPHKISDARKWLSRQLVDSRLSDHEAFNVVGYHPAIQDELGRPSPQSEAGERIARLEAALKSAIGNIEHMAAWITKTNETGPVYSFECLGEDMPDIRAALTDNPSKGSEDQSPTGDA